MRITGVHLGVMLASHEGHLVSAIFHICVSSHTGSRWFTQVAVVLLLTLTLFASAGSALAEKRVALVIGNSAYNNVSKLPNPANDAEAIGVLFKSVGFDVVEQRQNLGNAEMRRVIRDFSEKAQGADLAVVFFAGHGIEVDGVNYLIPTDSRLERDVDVEDEAVSLDRVLKMIEPAKRLRLVILDACRDNPFGKAMKRTIATRSIGRGLGPIEPSTSDTLIAFAAKAGSTAIDGAGPNSPFTAALLKHLVTPGLDVRLALGQVRDDVLKATGSKQEPFVYGSLGGSTVTLTALTKDEQATQQRVDPNADVARDYDAAAKVGTKDAWDAFLRVHPSGFYVDLARAQRSKVSPAKSVSPSATASESSANLKEQKRAKTATLHSEPSRKIENSNVKILTPQERCLAGVLRRQGGRFMPEGQSSSCMWGEVDGQLRRLGNCQKSRSDAKAMCRTGVFGGG